MRVIALLSFFDEAPELLIDCLAALNTAGVSHVVALDGRYQAFPAKQTVSPPNQHAAIQYACREFGMGCTLAFDPEPWVGEVEKRNHLFALGWTVARDGDWFWVQDADMIVTACPSDWLDRLAATEHDVAEVALYDCRPHEHEMRSLFRAQPIHLKHNHHTYFDAEGRVLWGSIRRGIDEVPALDLTAIRVEHRITARPEVRTQARGVYYAERDRSGIERGYCECGERAVALVARNWRISEDGETGEAEWHEACPVHARRWRYEADHQLRRIGGDPATVRDAHGGIPLLVVGAV